MQKQVTEKFFDFIGTNASLLTPIPVVFYLWDVNATWLIILTAIIFELIGISTTVFGTKYFLQNKRYKTVVIIVTLLIHAFLIYSIVTSVQLEHATLLELSVPFVSAFGGILHAIYSYNSRNEKHENAIIENKNFIEIRNMQIDNENKLHAEQLRIIKESYRSKKYENTLRIEIEKENARHEKSIARISQETNKSDNNIITDNKVINEKSTISLQTDNVVVESRTDQEKIDKIEKKMVQKSASNKFLTFINTKYPNVSIDKLDVSIIAQEYGKSVPTIYRYINELKEETDNA